MSHGAAADSTSRGDGEHTFVDGEVFREGEGTQAAVRDLDRHHQAVAGHTGVGHTQLGAIQIERGRIRSTDNGKRVRLASVGVDRGERADHLVRSAEGNVQTGGERDIRRGHIG